MNQILKIIRYQFYDNIRSKWLISFTILFLLLSYWLISFTAEPSKVLMSLLNLILLLLPLISIIFGTVYVYNNKNYITFMLSQPLKRTDLFSGLYFGLVIPLISSFVLGIGLPILFNLSMFSEFFFVLFILFVSGTFLILIFTAFAFLIAFSSEDRLKGLGLSIFLMLFLTIIYDGLILFLLQFLQDYPLEKLSLLLVLLNPIDLARILTVLLFDVSALMGYTGAVFKEFFGNNLGLIVSFFMMLVWFIIPFVLGLTNFNKKDI